MGELVCETCGTSWSSSLDLTYCGSCGAVLDENPSTAGSVKGTDDSEQHVPEAVEGELRYATILFADIKGFTAFSEGRPPDRVAGIVGNLLERLGRAVREEGGSVDKYIGDAVMATFGLIEPNPHAARTAVRSAFRMQDYIEDFCAGEAYDFSLRVGIHAGELVPVAVDDSFTVMGDSVNTAARIEEEAPPGGVLISGPIKKSLRGWGGFRKKGEVELKGKSGTTSLYVPLREQEREDEDQDGGVLQTTRFVGREDELQQVQRICDEVQTENDLRLLFVRGETGVGKSRFAEEVISFAEGRDFVCSDVRYDQMASGMLDGIGQIVADFFGLQLPGDPDRLLNQIRRQMKQRFTWVPEDRRKVVSEFFGFLLGIEQESFEIYDLPPDTKLETAWAELKNWLQGYARQQPVAWCLEDLQNGDRNTARFLDWCLDASWNGPVFIFCTVREEEMKEGSEWHQLITSPNAGGAPEKTADEERRGRQHTLRLDALSEEHLSEALSSSLPGPVQGTVMECIAEYCEGNPLFGVETLRDLTERDLLRKTDEDEWDLVTSWEQVELPETVREVMEARLQRLPRDGIRLAKRGGVVGQRFFSDSLSDVYGDQTDSLRKGKSVLQSRNLLFFEPSQFIQNLEEGVFENSRFRRTAAARATNSERREWMGSVADWCERTYETVENRSIAGQVLLPMLGRALDEAEQPGRARVAYEWAGWLLYENNRLEEAVTNFRNALFGFTDEDDPSREIRQEFGHFMFSESVEEDELQSLLTVREAQLRTIIGKTEGALGMLNTSLETLQLVTFVLESLEEDFVTSSARPLLVEQPELQRVFEETDHRWWELTPEESAILNLIETVDLEIKSGNLEKASTLVEQAWSLFDDLRSEVPDDRKHHLYSNWLYKKIWMKGESMGQPDEALEELQPIYEEEDPVVGSIDRVSPTNRADLSHLRSTLLFFTGDLERALQMENTVLDHWRDRERPDKEAPSLNLLGNIYRSLGEFDQAEEQFSGARDIYQNLGRRLEEAKTLGNLGSVYINRGELNRAEEAFDQYRNISQEIGFRQGEATALGNLGLVYLERGGLEQAARCFEDQIRISRKIQNRKGEVLALGNLGYVHHDRGEIEEALDCYREQLSISRDIGYSYGEEVALGSLAELLRNRFSGAVNSSTPDVEDAKEAYQFSREAIERVESSGNKVTHIHMLLNLAILLRWAGNGMMPNEEPEEEEVRTTGLQRLRFEVSEEDEERCLEQSEHRLETALSLCEETQIEPSLHAELLIERARMLTLNKEVDAAREVTEDVNELLDDAREQGTDVEKLERQLGNLQNRIE